MKVNMLKKDHIKNEKVEICSEENQKYLAY